MTTTTPASTAFELGSEDALRGYRAMVLSRRLEAKGWDLVRQNKVNFANNSAGHEAVSAGMGLAMAAGRDHLAPHYREVPCLLLLGVEPFTLLSTLYGRATGISHGRQPFGYWGSATHKVLSASGPQPAHLPHGIGAAWAAKRLGVDEVAWVSFGDGGASRGEFHEGLNIAAIHKLPVVFVCHNNGYTQSVPQRLESAQPDIALHAAGYGIPGRTVDGMDLFQVYGATAEARARAQAGEGPTLIEAKTYRFFANTSNDDDRRYRSREEVAEARKRDPIPLLAARLLEAGIADQGALEAIEQEAERRVAEAAAAAADAPDPDPAEAFRHTYAGEA